LEVIVPLVYRVQSIHDIAPDYWNACAGNDIPFQRHEFFSALEDSRTASKESGWLPSHLVVQHKGRIEAIAPLFLKLHSEGEFVFDYGWAAAYERAGGSYYPKLQSAIPYTPVPGQRFFLHPERSPDLNHRSLLRLAQQSLARNMNLSGAHCTFCERDEFEEFESSWLPRLGVQFHFKNQGYSSFEDFLSKLSARKRKAILKERRAVAQSGLEIKALTGAELGNSEAEFLFRCYHDTCSRKWGRAALEPLFFELLFQRMPSRSFS